MTVILRLATPEDALSISVLAMQVFLDTYAADGMRADLAREALGMYDANALATTIAASPARITVAEHNAHLVGFTEVERSVTASLAPLPKLVDGLECHRLYIQRYFKGMGIGRQLLHNAELAAAQSHSPCVWLKAWIGNAAAIKFYEKMEYVDAGRTQYFFEGVGHENIIFYKKVG